MAQRKRISIRWHVDKDVNQLLCALLKNRRACVSTDAFTAIQEASISLSDATGNVVAALYENLEQEIFNGTVFDEA